MLELLAKIEDKPLFLEYLTDKELIRLNSTLGYNDTFFYTYNNVTIGNILTFIDKRIAYDRSPTYTNIDLFRNIAGHTINLNIFNAGLPIISNN